MKKWMLTEKQIEQLNQQEKEKYLRAVQYKQNTHSGEKTPIFLNDLKI